MRGAVGLSYVVIYSEVRTFPRGPSLEADSSSPLLDVQSLYTTVFLFDT